MVDMLPHTAIGEFLVVLLPSLLVCTLICSSRVLWRALLVAAALGMAGLLVSYEVRGYPRVLVELVSSIAEFPFPYTIGVLSAVLAAGRSSAPSAGSVPGGRGAVCRLSDRNSTDQVSRNRCRTGACWLSSRPWLSLPSS